jgi:hypothetical protein
LPYPFKLVIIHEIGGVLMSPILCACRFNGVYTIIKENELKFKLIFIISSIALLLFLVSLIFVPYYILGSSLSASFWKMNLPLLLVWLFLFLALNIFYFTNKKLFLLLEKEDWPALIGYLEEQIISKGRYNSRQVRLLVNSYLVLSDTAAVMSLENKVAINKPALVDANVLVFGTARILGNDYVGAVRFFKTRKETAKAPFRNWVAWYYGFSLLLNRQIEAANKEFAVLASSSMDGVITALSSYFLQQNIYAMLPQFRQEFREISEAGRKRALTAIPKKKAWKREIDGLSADIHVAAISKYLNDTGIWLYS